MRLDLDMPVHCADSRLGELADVVIDPRTRRLTHLVVQPGDRDEDARLVPIAGADVRDGSDTISLQCTTDELSRLDPIHESALMAPGQLAGGNADWDVGIQEMYALPEPGGAGLDGLGTGMTMAYDQDVMVSYHRVPKGEVEIRRRSAVTSSDGHHLGHVVGFVLDDQKQIAQLVLEHGHLWGKHQVAIAGRAIERLQSDELTLSLSSHEVGALKPIR